MRHPDHLHFAQIHRFRDRVAVYIRGADKGRASTVYLTGAQARELSDTLAACAADVSTRDFGASGFRTVEIEGGE